MKMILYYFATVLFVSNLCAQNGFLVSEVHLDTVKISHNQTESNCCSMFYTTFEIRDSVITISEIDTGSICYCLCLFDVETTIGPLKKGNYIVYVYRSSQYFGLTKFSITEEASSFPKPQIVKFNQSDCGGNVLHIENEEVKLKEFQVKPIYPNPFNPTLNISFYIPKQGVVEINIFNQLGELVTNFLNEDLADGNHNYSWDGNILSSGMYFIQIRYKGINSVKKAMLVK